MEGPSPSSMGNLVPTSHPPSTKLPKQTRPLPGSLKQQLINREINCRDCQGWGRMEGQHPAPFQRQASLPGPFICRSPLGRRSQDVSLHGYILPLPEGPPLLLLPVDRKR